MLHLNESSPSDSTSIERESPFFTDSTGLPFQNTA